MDLTKDGFQKGLVKTQNATETDLHLLWGQADPFLPISHNPRGGVKVNKIQTLAPTFQVLLFL